MISSFSGRRSKRLAIGTNKLHCGLRDANHKINFEKSHFFKAEIEFLGHTVTKDGYKPSAEKTKAIKNYPVPKNADQARSFYGLCSFYRSFIYRFAEIASPIQRLFKKEAKFSWSEECQKAFEFL